MIQIDGLAEVVLNVRDPSRAVAFYGDLLGTGEDDPGRPAGSNLLSRRASDRSRTFAPRPGAASPRDPETSGTAHAASFGADRPGSRVR